jgi:hypothetical protein
MGKHGSPRMDLSDFVGQSRNVHHASGNHQLRCRHIQFYHAGLARGL